MQILNNECLAYHGWGFRANCWQAYESYGKSFTLWKSFDRGYFSPSNPPVCPNLSSIVFSADSQTRKVIIVHSLGLHFCPWEILEQAQVLILFNSFLDFHPSEPSLRKKSQRKLDRMIQAFQQTPQTVWHTFLQQTFYPDPILDECGFQACPPHLQLIANSGRLLQDLERLNQLSTTANSLRSLLKCIPKILIFTSSQDTIVSNPIQAIDVSSPGNYVQEILDDRGGHALPFSHFKRCIAEVERFWLSTENETI